METANSFANRVFFQWNADETPSSHPPQMKTGSAIFTSRTCYLLVS